MSESDGAGGQEPPALSIAIKRMPGGEGLAVPRLATPGSAGADLCAAVQGELLIAPGDRAVVPTGFAIALPAGFEAQVRPRSGLALKHGITLPNAPGTIDSDYRGEIKVILANGGHEPFTVKRGERIAQIVVARVEPFRFELVDALDETDRGAGGFGHTGR